MTMSAAEAKFQATMDAALDEYVRDTADAGDDQEFVADWVVGYTRQMITEDGVVWANSIIGKRGGNPNAHSGLAHWVGNVVDETMLDSIDLDGEE